MDDKYFELADTLLTTFFENRHNRFSEFSVSRSDKCTDKKLCKQLLNDLEKFDIITSTPSPTTVGDRIQLTALGLTIAQTPGAYRQFFEAQSTISDKHLLIDNSIKDSVILSHLRADKSPLNINIKANPHQPQSQPDKNDWIKSTLLKVWGWTVKFWWLVVAAVLSATAKFGFDHNWFGIADRLK